MVIRFDYPLDKIGELLIVDGELFNVLCGRLVKDIGVKRMTPTLTEAKILGLPTMFMPLPMSFEKS